MLEIKDLTGGYGPINVLRGVNLKVAQGEFVGILGHNGMGKSTLVKMIIGVLRSTGGSIRFAGQQIDGLAAHRRANLGIGYVPQGRRIFPNLTVHENLVVAARATGRDLSVVDRIVAELPTLARLARQRGGSLSGGEQQILALGRCLCTEPRLVLLDEPTEGVQPSIIDQMAEILARLHTSLGLATILVEQNLDFILTLSDRVAVLDRGCIVQEMDRHAAANVDQLSALMGFQKPEPPRL